jgi:hypothetical protein
MGKRDLLGKARRRLCRTRQALRNLYCVLQYSFVSPTPTSLPAKVSPVVSCSQQKTGLPRPVSPVKSSSPPPYFPSLGSQPFALRSLHPASQYVWQRGRSAFRMLILWIF